MATKTCKNGFKKAPCRKAKKGGKKHCAKGVSKVTGKCLKRKRARKSR
jgi:hypothetical protein